MDKKLQEYLDGLSDNILTSPNFANLTAEQRQEFSAKIQDHFNNVIFDTLLNNLNTEQLSTLKSLGLASPEAQQKIEEYAIDIPDFAKALESVLSQEVEKIKNNPQLITG